MELLLYYIVGRLPFEVDMNAALDSELTQEEQHPIK